MQYALTLVETEEFKDCKKYIDDTLTSINHPKLKKLADILTAFFSD